MGSLNQRIFRATVVVGMFTVIAKGGTAIRELMVARLFGRGDAIDALTIAYLLPSFVLSLLMSSLGSALIPTFIETRRNNGMEEAQDLFSSFMFLSLVLAGVVSLLLGLLAPVYLPYLASGFPAAKLSLTLRLLWVFLPFILINGMAACMSAVLSAFEEFALPALIPLMTPLVVILVLKLYAAEWGVFCVAVGTVVGGLAEACFLGRLLTKHGIRFSIKWTGLTANIRTVYRQYIPVIAGSFLLGFAGVVDQSMATMLPKGSVAALGYASKIVTAFSGIGGLALGTAVLPYFSLMVSERDWAGCRGTFKRYLGLVCVATVPLTLGLILFAQPLIRVLLQRGAFSGSDTQVVSSVLVCYSIQIPFYVAGMVSVRFLSSIKRNDVLMYGAVLSLFLDVVLNILLMRIWGVAGIALSTSLVYFVSFLFLGLTSFHLLAREERTTQLSDEGQEMLPTAPNLRATVDHD